MPDSIPFGRVLSYKRINTLDGRDVLAVSRCLHRLGYRWREPTFEFGWRMRDNVELFRRHQNMNAIGVYDLPTHQHLSPLFEDYEKWLYTHAGQPKPPVGATNVDKLMHAIWTLYAQRPWHYHAVRPFLLYPNGHPIRYTFDCSWLVTQAFYMAGLADPNDYGYKGGYGNTESLRSNGRQVSTPAPADLVFYGYYGSSSNPAHVAMMVGHGKCIGFGSEAGPRLLDKDYRPVREYRRYV